MTPRPPSSTLFPYTTLFRSRLDGRVGGVLRHLRCCACLDQVGAHIAGRVRHGHRGPHRDRKSTRLNSSHVEISYAVFCLKKKKLLLSCGAAFPRVFFFLVVT